jgi:transposase
MVASPVVFLSGYLRRDVCGCGFSAGKGRFGRVIGQEREGRQQTALFSNAFFHNLYAVRINPK